MKFFKNLFRFQQRPTTRHQKQHRLRVALARQSLRPRIENLETRALLATVTWDGGGGDFQWGNDLNWSTDAQPQLADDVLIGNIGSPVAVNVPVNVATIDSSVGIVLGGLTPFQVVTGNFAGGFSVTASNSVNLGTSTIAGGAWNSATVNGMITNTGLLSFPGLSVNFGQITNQGTMSISTNTSGTLVNLAGANIEYLAGTHVGSVSNSGELNSSGSVVINAALDNSGTVSVLGSTLTLGGVVSQYVGNTLSAGTWIANDGVLDMAFSGTNITILGPSATVSLIGASASFDRIKTVDTNQGTLELINHPYLGSSGAGFTNSGTFVVDGGSYAQSVAISYDQSGGSTTLLNGASLSASVTVNGGIFSGNGTVSGLNFTNNAVVVPGQSPGILNITGNYVQSVNGTLQIEVQGTNALTPDFDQLIVGLNATLDGTLTVLQTNNFLADKSENFRIIQAASRTGDFSTINLPQRNGRDLISASPGATFYDLQGTAYIVRNTNDAGAFSLREQIGNANGSPGLDQILFNVSGAGVQTLSPASFLPGFTDPIILDGTSQPLYAGTPLIEIDGTGAGAGVSGVLLALGSDGSTIQGLAINRFQVSGFDIQSSNNTISSNFVGTNPLGTLDQGNSVNGIIVQSGAIGNVIQNNLVSGNNATGITLLSNGSTVRGNKVGTNFAGTGSISNPVGVLIVSATGNTIGGSNPGDGNLVSGNSSAGLQLSASANGNTVAGNWIGTTFDGLSALPNAAGVVITNSSFNNTIGGTTPGARNIISGNTQSGVLINLSGTGNNITGNYIGTDNSGTLDLGNIVGIQIDGASPNNVIGGTIPGARNVISGNETGILIDTGLAGNQVKGNFIGTDFSGTAAIGNSLHGLFINNGSNNVIGGLTADERNIVSGNFDGIVVMGPTSTANTIVGNYIGTDVTGAVDLGNSRRGVHFAGNNNILGGTTVDMRNVISGNNGPGIYLASTSNTIQGNYIGVDVTGLVGLGNSGTGIEVPNGSTGNLIGGFTSIAGTGAGNIISGNGGEGISLIGPLTDGNIIPGNLVGLASDGVTVIANSSYAVVFGGGTTNNLLGGDDDDDGVLDGDNRARNIISGSSYGVVIAGAGVGNRVQGNYIGTDRGGSVARPNTLGGISLVSGAGAAIGGTSPGAGNVISGNTGPGLSIGGGGAGTTGVVVEGNIIGLNSDGNSPLGNVDGVQIADGAISNTIGGTTPAARNIISGNSQNGVLITGIGTTGNQIYGNYIGIDSDGVTIRGNDNGVLISDAAGNFVGSGDAGAGNVISGNAGDVVVVGPNAIGNRIQGNRVSLTADGLSLIAPSFGYGVYVANGAVDTVIGTFDDGTNDADEGNLIGFASTAGIFLQDAGAAPDGTIIAGNRLGLDVSGATLSTGIRGIWVAGATDTRIGSDADGASDADERNVIVPSGNGAPGILLSGGSLGATTGTSISGNYIGLDPTGEFGRSNTTNTGILLQEAFGHGVSNTTIGGLSANAKNVIGSMSVGIELNGVLVTNNSILGNFIGTDQDGVASIPNNEGVAISEGANNNTVGGPTSASRNVISGNVVGVHVSGSDNNTIASNFVGLQADGLTSLANSDTGVYVNGNSNNTTIGGESLTMEAANYIGGGGGYGIALLPTPGTTGNKVVGNFVGLNQAEQVRGNALAGIIVKDTNNITIGGTVAGSKNVISGSLGSGVWINNASNTTVQGNFIGTDSTGELDRGNQGGVALESGSFGNTIGGLTAAARNIISGNDVYGVGIHHVGSINNNIQGNYIGTDDDGVSAVANGTGIEMTLGASHNTVGGSIVGAGNVISGNTGHGVLMNGTGTDSNTVAGNFIGTDKDGASSIGNASSGISITTANNVIGGATAASRNIISGNAGFGVLTSGTGATGNLIRNNFIGTDVTGEFPIGNSTGVSIQDGANILRDNVISGNSGGLGHGVYVSGPANGSVIAGNIIGLDDDGTDVLANQGDGISIAGAVGVMVGGTTAADRNVVSGNLGKGVLLTLNASGNTIAANYIGTNASGTASMANETGIEITSGASNNTIGGSIPGARNIISGNSATGVVISGVGVSSNVLLGNYVGTNAQGDAALGNSTGVWIEVGASDNTVGGSDTASRNLISGNTAYGIQVTGAGFGNKLQGNYIGTDWTGSFAIGNASVQPAGAGIRLSSMAGNTVHIGTDGDGLSDAKEGNVISGNFGYGIRIQGGNNDTGSHVVAGNFIGVSADGASALPNQNDGIFILTSRSNRIGTNGDGISDEYEANVISGNRNLGGNPGGPGIVPAGIRLTDSITNDGLLTASNTIAGNTIGLNVLGTASIGNQGSGIVIQDGSSNTIGGSLESQRNVISGNNGAGIAIEAGVLSDNNVLRGNWIGLGSDGDTVFGNALNGIQLLSGTGTVVGGFTSIPGQGSGNVISGNSANGIFINGSNNEFIRGNLIGLDATGSRDRGNSGSGIALANGTPHLIGGDDDDDGALDGVIQARNVISGNNGIGIGFSGGPQNVSVQGNYVGTNIAGTFAIPNSSAGIQVGSSYSVVIGGTTVGAGNLISGNTGVGISTIQQNLPLQTVTIQGNIVGADAAGTYAIPNLIGGISTNNLLANSVTIGGGTNASRNLISGNTGYGVRVLGSQVAIEGNYVGTNLAGINDLGNGGIGILIDGSSSHTVRNNTISGNNGGGIRLNAGSTNTVLTANSIGTSANGILAIPNGTLLSPAFGIEFDAASANNLGGSPSNRNIISANYGDGVVLKNGASDNNLQFNWIGANAIDSAALGNSAHAVHMLGATTTSNVIQGNLIYYNGGSALRLEDTTSTTGSANLFDGNDYRNNLGQTIDIGPTGPSLNDGLDTNPNNLRDYPVIISANIVGEELEIAGFSPASGRVDFFLSSPALDGRGKAVSLLAANLIEGSVSDLDNSIGSYGSPHAASTISANQYRFRLPLPDEVRFGTLITGVGIGSISELSNVVAVGLTTADLENNLAPIVSIQSSATIGTGESLAVTGSFLDDDSNDWSATIDYGDGTGTHVLILDKVARAFSIDYPYNSSGIYTVSIQVQDNGGKVGSAAMSLLVQNEAPVLTYNKFSITSKVAEGGFVVLDGLFSDTGLTDQHVVTIDWGDGSIVQSNVPNSDLGPIPSGAQSFQATHRYVDDGVSNTPRDSYRVQVTVTDNGNLSDTSPDGLFVIEVVNVRPSNIVATLPGIVSENTPVILTGSFVDPGVLDAHTVKVSWGDGTSEVHPVPVVGQRTFSLTHIYKDNSTAPATDFEITIEVSDDDEPLLPTTLKKRISVANALPSIAGSDIVLSNSSINENGSISLSASFADAGSIDKHQVVIDWGDGSEPKTIDLAAGVTSISAIEHRYLDDPTGAGPNAYTIAVKVRDEDMPVNDFVVATKTIFVENLPPAFVAPALSPILTFTSGGNPVTGPLPEGSRVTVTGQYSDHGTLDVPVVTIDWGDGTSSLAYVSSTTKTFLATHHYLDDNEATNGLITVTADDQDGGSATTTTTLLVQNLAPIARILPKSSSNASLIELDAISSDPGINDLPSLQYSWTVSSLGPGSPPVVSGLNSSTLSIDRNGNFTDPYSVTLTVTDDEGDFVTVSTHLILLDDNPNNFAPPLSSQPIGVDFVTIMGFAGSDTLDLRNWTVPVILDGGANTDTLYGGTADDVLILHQGNDSGYGGGGGDRYLMTFNSILTVEDNLGGNILDFSPTSFGVTFDLNLAVTSSSDIQDVFPSNPGLHQADIDGTFVELIGTALSDRLTGTSGALVDGGSGNDRLFSPHGVSSDLRFRGGLDDDLLTVDILSSISEISFEGDLGADEFIVFGDVTTLIDFDGGADDDLLTIQLDSIVNEVSFEGDFGADEFLLLGEASYIDFDGGADDDVLTIELDAIVNEVSFEGDFGADEFVLLGDVTSLIDFDGGADDDLLVIQTDSVVNEVSFEGDMGADDFYVFGEVTSSIEFSGGADDDLLSIELTADVLEVSFEGDFGADEFLVMGEVGTIVFDGGADDDLLEIALDSLVSEVSFEGDVGADEFVIHGEVTGPVEFSGGADSDLFVLAANSILNEVSFEGDDGRDRMVVQGTILSTDSFDDPLIPNVPGSPIPRDFGLFFRGGNDDDVLTVSAESTLLEVSFEGDLGADEFYVFADGVNLIDFSGGADDDLLYLGTTATIEEVSFEGDLGADELYIYGDVTTTIDFGGGADDDVLVLGSESTVLEISFEGDVGADEFYVYGDVTQTIAFNGGADDDLLVFGIESSLQEVSFEGDVGADEFYILGEVQGLVFFDGGADDDLLSLAVESTVSIIDFEGDLGADELLIFGDVVNSIEFSGGADGDRLHNRASGLHSITFYGFAAPTEVGVGFDGKDLFVNSGSSIETIAFFGGQDDDVLYSIGSDILEVSFEGDFGTDIFIVDGTAIGSIDFKGGADDDVLSITGSEILEVSFEGDDGLGDGADTLINRAQGVQSTTTSQPSTIFFNGLGGVDAFRNDGNGWDGIVFLGGDDNDAFQNNADSQSNLRFEGDAGDDIFENNGSNVSTIVYFGGSGNDTFVNDGNSVTDLQFVGAQDDDLLLNTGNIFGEISFEGDEGSDSLINFGESVEGLTFVGGHGDERWINAGIDLRLSTMIGGAGNDTFVNRSTAIGITNFRFESGIDDDGQDRLINQADQAVGLYFEGGAEEDLFQNSGYRAASFEFLGGDGDDSALNLGAELVGWTMVGGVGNDVMENRANGVKDLRFDGGDGDDMLLQRGSNITQSDVLDLNKVAVEMLGGPGVDVLANFGLGTSSVKLDGGIGNDRLLNSSSNVQLIWFIGGDGNDALQNNSPNIGEIRMFGEHGEDSLFNNGSSVRLIDFEGGVGSDTLISTGSFIGDSLAGPTLPTGIQFLGGDHGDLLRVSGRELVRLLFDAGDGDDSLLYNASGTQVDFLGGLGDDVFSFRGTASILKFEGNQGNDRIVYAGLTPNLGVLTSTLDGGDGDDRYEFAGTPQGWVGVNDAYLVVADFSADTLDFSAYSSGSVTLDLASTQPQPQPGNLTLQLSHGMGLERILGSSGADVIQGNDRDNYIGGAQFYYPASTLNPVPYTRPTQWVYLDFDNETNGAIGEHVYTTIERDEIQRRVEGVYYGYETDGTTPRLYSSPERWFDVRFTQSLSAIANAGVTDFVTIKFNGDTPSGRPGGDSSEIDLGNQNYGGTAIVQVNGLLGGIEVPVPANEDFVESLPEDAEQSVGQDKPPATSENFVALSVKIAAHELAHLLGLRHYDSFGPVGFGIHSPPGVASFKPQYQGVSAAFETFEHIIGSPASVGSTRANDVGQLFFGEREAVKIAVSMSDANSVVFDESALATASVSVGSSVVAARHVDLATIQVPNTLAKGINSAKNFYVQAASVLGSIELQGNASESDYYTFSGQAGDLVTIELASRSMRRFTNNGIDGYIDSILRLRDQSGQIVQTFFSDAVNDDEFESSDSLLMDIRLPSTGTYSIEVDTFARLAGDDGVEELLEAIAQLEAISNPSQDQLNALSLFIDSRDDTDVGGYQLFIYNFAQANRLDLIDTLEGRGGVDVLDGGPGEDYSIQMGSLPSGATLDEGNLYSASVSFTNPGADSWMAFVDYGDGTPVVVYTAITPHTGLNLAHIYPDNGVYSVLITLINDDLASDLGSFAITVSNVAPLPSIDTISSPRVTGTPIHLFASASDPAGVADTVSLTWHIFQDLNPVPSFTGTGTSFSFLPTVVGSYTIRLTASDEDGGSRHVESTINVANGLNHAPQITIQTPADGAFFETSTIQLSAIDADTIDQGGQFTYIVDWGDGSPLTVVTGSSTESVSHTYTTVSPSGAFTIRATTTDGRGMVSTEVAKPFVVLGWAIMTDPLPGNIGDCILVVVGSQGSDAIKIKDKSGDYLKIKIKDREDKVKYKGTMHGDVDRILVFGHGGDDDITLDDDIEVDATIWGGFGDDKVKGGEGNDILFGDEGDDILYGRDGRDILIGGTGADKIYGDSHDDILIAGYTIYDNGYNHANALSFDDRRFAIESIMQEWASNRTYAQRQANILGTGSGSSWTNRKNGSHFLKSNQTSSSSNTVFDDLHEDSLWGDSGVDWFFANIQIESGSIADRVRDRSSAESQRDIDRWW